MGRIGKVRSSNGRRGERDKMGRISKVRREKKRARLSEMIFLGVVKFMMVPFPRFTKAIIV